MNQKRITKADKALYNQKESVYNSQSSRAIELAACCLFTLTKEDNKPT